MKELIIFDLDGTLAKSKSAVDDEMVNLLTKLLTLQKVAIISGGDWPQFQKQVLNYLPGKASLGNLFILPTSGTKYYTYNDGWQKQYAETFTDGERKNIMANLEQAVENAHLNITKTWGDQIEDRGSQITFSALGQQAPLDAKKGWDPNFEKRKKIVEPLRKKLPDFSIGMGGTTSIDITKPGIDKAYGINKLTKLIHINIAKMLFIGDALLEGGNDYPARKTGVDCIQVRDPEETKRIIETIIACTKQ